MSILSDTEFGLSVLNQFSPDESVVFSPTSFSLALALIHAGANGETKEEIRKVLVGDSSNDELEIFYKSVVASLKKKSNCLLKMGTTLLIDSELVENDFYREFHQFQREVEKKFSARIYECSTLEDPLELTREMNRFVTDVTNGTVTNCMDPRGSSFSDIKGMKDLKSLLLNNGYFEGKWKDKFFENDVIEGDFYIKDDVTQKVEYLEQHKAKRMFASTDDVEVLTLPFEDKKYSFTIILPKNRFGLKEFRSGLTCEKLQTLLHSVKKTYVDISIPKFKLEMETDATKILKALGVSKGFCEGAELGKFYKNMWINMVHHNAVVEINESGTKPGNVSYKKVTCSTRSKTKKSVKFVADHPFLFFICRKDTIIFSGQYSAPRKELWEHELYEPLDLKSTPFLSNGISDTQFGLSFLKQLPNDESAIISPTSIAFALSLVHAGAKENVQSEIRKALLGDISDEEFISYYRYIYACLREKNKAAVRIANRIFIREGFEVMNSYKTNIAKNFAAEAENLDFSNVEGAVMKINDFVKKITDGMIPQCMSPSSIDSETNTVITNAIYFEGTWAHRFTDYGDDATFTFYKREGVWEEIKYLSHREVHKLYGETEEAEILTLPYTDPKYTFTIILPKKLFGLAELRDSLTEKRLQELFKSVEISHIHLKFPKFTVETEPSTTKILKSLGITSMFEKNADLEGIAPNVWISEVKHKAIIEVNENGTRAAGVTYVPGCGYCGTDEPIKAKFEANHPFLYFIRREDKILFSGQFCG